MQLDLDNLPSDPELLQRLVRDIATAIDHRDTEIECFKSIIKQLQRMQFGRSSERIDPDQQALGLEDIDSDIARIEDEQPKHIPEATATQPRRKALPDHLPREDVLLDIEGDVCSCCGDTLHLIGRASGLGAGPGSRRAHHSSQIRLSSPQQGDASGRARPGDSLWPRNSSAARARVDQQILRSPSALSTVSDL
jgi:hypothetical protein